MKTRINFVTGGAAVLVLMLAVILSTNLALAQKAGSAQQIAVAKTIKSGLTTIGILSSTIDDKGIEGWTRAGMTQGIKIIIGKPKSMSEIAGLYKSIVKDKGAQLILIPDAADELMTGIGFEFLRESSVADQVGVMVPLETLVASGGLCYVTNEGGKLKAFVNQRMAQVIGANVPSEPGTSVTYVVK
jgi:hypothetical protein